MTSRLGMLHNALYREDIGALCESVPNLASLDGATVAISGATGMIGTMLVDVLMRMPEMGIANPRVIALGRSEARGRERLPYFDRPSFSFRECDISANGGLKPLDADVVFHLASTTHPRAYSTQPIATITSNMLGLINLFESLSMKSDEASRFVFASSVEVYGENRGDRTDFDEGYCGFIDCCTLRAGYPESKRCGEALCIAYASERDVQTFIPRLPRTYGPTMLPSDSKAISQFIKNALHRQDIVLKSAGTQTYSYLYVADVVRALLHVLLNCKSETAYNIADAQSNVSLRDLAEMIAALAGTNVVFELPDAVESMGYSTATYACMNPERVSASGWRARYSLNEGLQRTLRIMNAVG